MKAKEIIGNAASSVISLALQKVSEMYSLHSNHFQFLERILFWSRTCSSLRNIVFDLPSERNGENSCWLRKEGER